MKNSKLLLSALAGLGLYSVSAQELSVDAMIRPRFEYRNGFIDAIAEDQEASAFVEQRSSLLLKYTDEKITTFLDIQSTNFWGDRAQLSPADDNLRVNQGWAEIKLGEGWSTKLGRMQLSYDDQRILGGLGWAQQQRTHDAALARYKSENFKADLGFAFNQNGAASDAASATVGNSFTASGAGVGLFQYKAMQYLQLNGKIAEGFTGSFLFMNNTFETVVDGAATETTFSKQTTGVYGKYKKEALGIEGSFYYQFGEANEATDLSAYQALLNVTYKTGSTLLGIGGEILSGDDADSVGENEAFFPLFGTNHKFNGFQDFFYVGRHANNVGLIDLNAKAVFKTGPKSKVLTKLHYFSGASETDYLGTSLDVVYTQGITPYAIIKLGFSNSLLDDDFADARVRNSGEEASSIQSWGWIMLTVKPNLFKWKKEPQAAK